MPINIFLVLNKSVLVLLDEGHIRVVPLLNLSVGKIDPRKEAVQE